MFKFDFEKDLIDLKYCADYFIKSKNIINKNFKDNNVTMQWFQRKNNIVLCGMEYIIKFLKYQKKPFEIEYLKDGEIINENDVVLKITGKYQDFCHFEGLFDGILSRCSSIATNARNLKLVANKKEIINMGDRADIFKSLPFDGYASIIGGIDKLVTEKHYQFLDKSVALSGTMPHALIAFFDGDIIKAAEAYIKEYPYNPLVCLVDFNNDCVNDTLTLANHFKEKLTAIRIDTSQGLIDKSLEKLNMKEYGVNPSLVRLVREELDKNGHNHVKIIVSSGFNEEKIKYFEDNNTPVDIYGVGEDLFKKKTNFTGDLVKINGIQRSKVGRKELFSNKLLKIKL